MYIPLILTHSLDNANFLHRQIFNYEFGVCTLTLPVFFSQTGKYLGNRHVKWKHSLSAMFIVFQISFLSSGPENNEPVLITQPLNFGHTYFFPFFRQFGAVNRKLTFSVFLRKGLLQFKFKRLQVSPYPTLSQTPFKKRFHVK